LSGLGESPGDYATLNSNHPRDGTPIYIAGNSLFFPETGRFSKKNREANEHESGNY
jgi:hypothetical protein